MNSTAIAAIILFVTFFGLIALRIPVTFSLVASTLVSGFYLHVPLVTIFQRMGQGVYSFSFLAIPFFILAGEIMGAGSITNNHIMGWRNNHRLTCRCNCNIYREVSVISLLFHHRN